MAHTTKLRTQTETTLGTCMLSEKIWRTSKKLKCKDQNKPSNQKYKIANKRKRRQAKQTTHICQPRSPVKTNNLATQDLGSL